MLIIQDAYNLDSAYLCNITSYCSSRLIIPITDLVGGTHPCWGEIIFSLVTFFSKLKLFKRQAHQVPWLFGQSSSYKVPSSAILKFYF